MTNAVRAYSAIAYYEFPESRHAKSLRLAVTRVLAVRAGTGGGLYYGDIGGLAWMCCGAYAQADTDRARAGRPGQVPSARC